MFKADILKRIIESTSAELSSLDVSDNLYLKAFKDGRRAYFLNDIQGLKTQRDFFLECKTNFKYALICQDILELRLLIREPSDLSPSVLETSNKYQAAEQDEVLKVLLVELYAVEAILADNSKQAEMSYEKNKKASLLAKDLGLDKKASTLNYNAIVAMNHKHPAQLRICNLVEAQTMAAKVSDHNTQIAALSSLAQEYEALGCYNLAYEEASKSLELAKNYCFGSFNFCYTLLLVARISVYSGRSALASEHIKLVETFGFKELEGLVNSIKQVLINREKDECMSGDEQRLVSLLTDGPKDKYFIIEKLYGLGDLESLENRMKQLLLRIRKKKHGLIYFNKKDNVYELTS